MVSNDELWQINHHFECLIEDVTGFNLQKDLCSETVKYMAQRLSDTKYHKIFRHKYTIYQDEYQALVEKFNHHANNNGSIGVQNENEKEKVY